MSTGMKRNQLSGAENGPDLVRMYGSVTFALHGQMEHTTKRLKPL